MGSLRFKNALKLAVVASFFLSGVSFAVESTSSLTSFPKMDEPSGAGGYKPHVGIMAGYADPEDSFDPSVEYGLDVGFQPYIPFGLGAELTTLSSDGPRGADLDRTKLLLKGTYNFGGTNTFVRLSYVGLGVGAVFDSVTGADDAVNLGVAPMVGFDYPVAAFGGENRYLSIGANAKYLMVGADHPDVFTLNGLMKYWF